MTTDPKAYARMIAVLGGVTVLLGGGWACGSSSPTTGPATTPAAGVKKEAGTRSVNLRIIGQDDAPSDGLEVKICSRAAFSDDSCKDTQPLLFGQVADMSAPKVVGTIYNLGAAAYVDFEAINPPVGAPYMTFKASGWDDEPVSTIGLSEGESTTVDSSGYAPNRLVLTRDADTSDYKMLRLEIRGRAPSDPDPVRSPDVVGCDPRGGPDQCAASAPVDPETAKTQLLAMVATYQQLSEQGDPSQPLDAKKLQAMQAEAERLAAAQQAAHEAGLAAIDKANMEATVAITAGVASSLANAGIQVPSGGSLTPAQRATVLDALGKKEQSFVDAVKLEGKAVDLPADDPRAQAARDAFDQAAADARARADQVRAQADQVLAQARAAQAQAEEAQAKAP